MRTSRRSRNAPQPTGSDPMVASSCKLSAEKVARSNKVPDSLSRAEVDVNVIEIITKGYSAQPGNET